MQKTLRHSVGSEGDDVAHRYLRPVCISADAENLSELIEDAFAEINLAHLFVFASSSCNFSKLMSDLHRRMNCPVGGCTSVGANPANCGPSGGRLRGTSWRHAF